jgi:hypothetical protein
MLLKHEFCAVLKGLLQYLLALHFTIAMPTTGEM